MKKTAALLMALGLALPAMTLAQDNDNRPPRNNQGPGQGQGPGEGQRRPTPPLMDTLDVNHDGVIDADEIKNASANLGKLDKNHDGKITQDEMRPARPGGGAGGNAGGPGAGPGQGPRPPQE